MPIFSRKYMAPLIGLFFLAALPVYSADKVREVIEKASFWFLNIIIAIAVIMVLVGAFSLVTSGGDAKKVEKGRNTILWGVGGVAVALLAKAIVDLVGNLVG